VLLDFLHVVKDVHVREVLIADTHDDDRHGQEGQLGNDGHGVVPVSVHEMFTYPRSGRQS
jgi:hypothetical protein